MAVGGIDVHPVDTAAAVETIIEWSGSSTPHLAVGLNAHLSNQCARDPALREHLRSADLVYADGMSIVWAARLLGRRLPERIATTDLALPLIRASAREGRKVFFLGGAPGVAEEARLRILRRVPGAQIATRHGYDLDDPGVVAQIVEHGTEVLFVGLGDPRQQEWVAATRDALGAGAVLTCGGLFDWLSGRHRRAPQWMIRAGLEWLWRLLIEPRRLARRYLLGNPEFIVRVLRQRLRG